MGDLSRDELARAEAIFEETFDDESAWEDDPAPGVGAKHRLATQVTVRLSADVAEQLRRIATTEGVGYTSLIRRWIEERAAEEVSAVSGSSRVRYTIAATIPASTTSSFEWSQRSVAFERV